MLTVMTFEGTDTKMEEAILVNGHHPLITLLQYKQLTKESMVQICLLFFITQLVTDQKLFTEGN